LAVLHGGNRGPALVRSHADLEEVLGLVPVDQLGGDDAGVGPERFFQQQAHGVGRRGHVVVAEEEVGGAFHHLEDLVGGRAEARVAGDAADVGGGQHGRHPGGGILGAGRVDHEDGQARVVLRRQGGQAFLQPGPRVVGDDDRDDGRCRGRSVHQGCDASGGGPSDSGQARTPVIRKLLAIVRIPLYGGYYG